MDLFFGCEEVYERKVSGCYLEKVLTLPFPAWGFFLPSGDSVGGTGLLYQDGRRSETRTDIYSEMVEQFLLAQNPSPER